MGVWRTRGWGDTGVTASLWGVPRTLLEAKVGDPLYGRVSLLHEFVEADEEGFLLLFLTPGGVFFHWFVRLGTIILRERSPRGN